MWVTCCLPVWRWSCPMFRLFRLSLRRHTCIVQPSPWWCWNKYNLCNLCSLAETTGTEGCKTLAQLRRVEGDIRNYKHVAANIWMSPCCLFSVHWRFDKKQKSSPHPQSASLNTICSHNMCPVPTSKQQFIKKWKKVFQFRFVYAS